MGRKNNLGCLERRDLLNQSVVSVENLLRWGREYEESGLIYDAVDFYEKANAREDLSRIMGEAVQEGNLFLYRRVCRFLAKDPSPDEWLDVAKHAEESGKLAFAAEAYRIGGDEEGIKRCTTREGFLMQA